jgi:hypothetical protein
MNIMIYRGIVKGKTIELEESLPYDEGQPVSLSIEPLTTQPPPGSPAVIRQMMHEPPHLRWEDVDELEQAIEEGQSSVRQEGEFDKE